MAVVLELNAWKGFRTRKREGQSVISVVCSGIELVLMTYPEGAIHHLYSSWLLLNLPIRAGAPEWLMREVYLISRDEETGVPQNTHRSSNLTLFVLCISLLTQIQAMFLAA